MEKKIEDYLHLYLGCDAIYKNGSTEIKGQMQQVDITCMSVRIIDSDGERHEPYIFNIKPILRPLSDMTEEECNKLDWSYMHIGPFKDEKVNHRPENLMPDEFLFLLSKSFDLFGLIESGLAIDKTKISHLEGEGE